MLTPATFRDQFPVFSSTSTYPDTEIQFWIDLAAKLHSVERWGDLYDYGVSLFVAHNLSLEFSSTSAAAAGQAPGQVVGALSSASVDKVSYSRDASSAMDPKNGHWNLTTYGLRWVKLVRMVGAGPIQVGVPSPSEGQISNGGFWPGVIPPPF